MDIKSKVRIIKKGTVETKRQSTVNIEVVANSKVETKDVKFAVVRNIFRITQGLPDIQRSRCLVCSGRIDVVKKAQEYWNRLTDGERSLCSVEAIAYEGSKGQKADSVTLWNSLMGYNEKALSKEEMACIRR